MTDLSLDREALKWVIEKDRLELAAERETVIALRERHTKMSERRAYGLVGLRRSIFRYEGERRAKDEGLTATLKTLALDTSIPIARVIRELEAAIAESGKPRRICMDNGSEFASREFQAWCIA